jgi:NAD(P)-dependent dehydrogenase (short-subunit alcohol dehydrogenase family)
VVEEIQEQTGNQMVNYLVADLSSQEQIRKIAQKFKHLYRRLDVLINNAGAMFIRRQENQDGLEMTFAVNHLSFFLLTNLLLETMTESAPSRIINVSSNAHRRAKLDFDDLQNKRGYWGMGVYGQSKLANVLFTYELARRLQGTGVTVNAMHPGFVATNMGANNGWVVRLLLPLIHRNSLTSDEGAETCIYLACSPEVEGVTGKYFFKNAEFPSSKASHDPIAASRLWRISAELTNAPEWI